MYWCSLQILEGLPVRSAKPVIYFNRKREGVGEGGKEGGERERDSNHNGIITHYVCTSLAKLPA